MHDIELKVLDSRVGKEFPLPSYSTDGAAALDLRAALEEPLHLPKGGEVVIGTGVALHIRNANLAGLILPRSGLGTKHGIVLSNLTGLIDSDYQGEIMIPCWNRSLTDFLINPGDRIAQLVLIPVVKANLVHVDRFTPSLRGENGFGHTGIQ